MFQWTETVYIVSPKADVVEVDLTFTLSTLRISSSSKDSSAADVQWMQSTGLN